MDASKPPDPAAAPDRELRQALAAAPDAPLLVGYSGGLDSTVLLHALADDRRVRARGLRALHVDHGLQAASGDWARHCRSVCAGLGIGLEIRRVQVDADSGLGPEAAARQARHAAFREEARPGEVLVLAQHRDDQVETVLLRLLRGSGGAALAAMDQHARLGMLALWRPLLDLTRSQLRAVAQARGLRWIEDPSNADSGADRNFLRHEVLPGLRQRFPGTDAALARSARLLAEDAERLLADDRRRLALLRSADPAVLELPRLLEHPPATRHALLRLWLRELGLPTPPGRVLDRVDRELLQARADAEPALRWPGGVLRRHRSCLHAHRPRQLPTDWSLDWDLRAPLHLPGDFGELAFDPPPSLPGSCTVRPRSGGEKMSVPGHASPRPLKRLLQDAGIPPWERERLPLLFAADGELLAAGDLLPGTRLAQAGGRLRWTPRD